MSKSEPRIVIDDPEKSRKTSLASTCPGTGTVGGAAQATEEAPAIKARDNVGIKVDNDMATLPLRTRAAVLRCTGSVTNRHRIGYGRFPSDHVRATDAYFAATACDAATAASASSNEMNRPCSPSQTEQRRQARMSRGAQEVRPGDCSSGSAAMASGNR